ncbi:MFS transporter [Streptomyces sp. NBC_01443]|uniref:MFS transporter n=1 Tax=Streptomyces sp. NBC_01443 TaxID=2903868 RepID=UPI00224F0F0E|nr:MFS transporter [Streptomyces sp. NBC_01443]MCX4632015.1 MFS transporter [Streptomyces sp. NBC_01443]
MSATREAGLPEAGRPVLTTVAIAASLVAFVVIGALQALYGPAIPALREEYGISPAGAGLSLSAHFVGALLGVLIYHVLRGRLNNRVLLGGSYLLMAAGATLFAFSPSWNLALTGTFVIGLGFGGIDYGLNQLFAIGFGRRSTAMLNVLNGHFGVGAIAGPALIGWLGADRYPQIFLGIGVVCLLILATLGGVAAREPEPAPAPAEGGATSGARVLPIIAVFIGIYVLHVAIETGVGGWEPTHLEAVGYGAATAATATSAYWAAMTIGRFVVAPLSLRWSAPSILIVCCAGMAGFLVLATVPALAPYAYFGVGLMIAPIFPTCLPWLNRAVPGVAAAGAYVIAASMIGGVAFPPLLGGVIDTMDVKALPLVLFGLAAVCAALSLWLRKNAPDPDGVSGPRNAGADRADTVSM